jgi:hypothetical protein
MEFRLWGVKWGRVRMNAVGILDKSKEVMMYPKDSIFCRRGRITENNSRYAAC